MSDETENMPYDFADRFFDAVLSHLFTYFLGMVTTALIVVAAKA